MSKRIHSSSPSTDREPKQSKTAPHEEATHILDMNNDCFEAVFSHLRAEDLCVVKQVCQRFEAVADDHFQRKYRNVAFAFNPNQVEVWKGKAFVLSANVLRHFGKFIQMLWVHGISGENGAEQWRDIILNCAQLKELYVRGCDLTCFEPRILPTDSVELKKLELYTCFPRNVYGKIIEYFKKLHKLTVGRDPEFKCHGEYLRHHYQQLKEVTVSVNLDAKESFFEFTRKNPQIKRMFVNADANILGCSDLDTIAENCKNLKSLCISGSLAVHSPTPNYSVKLTGLTRLEKLEYLHINCSNHNMTSTIDDLSERNTLKSLSLTRGEFDVALCAALCKLTNLKGLQLSEFCGINADFVKTLMNALNLICFDIIFCEGVKLEDVAAASKYAPTLESMRFAASRKNEFLNEPLFLQLVKARKESGAISPLTFHQSAVQLKKNDVCVETIEANAGIIRLAGFDYYK